MKEKIKIKIDTYILTVFWCDPEAIGCAVSLCNWQQLRYIYHINHFLRVPPQATSMNIKARGLLRVCMYSVGYTKVLLWTRRGVVMK
jgi:hypothetical protein